MAPKCVPSLSPLLQLPINFLPLSVGAPEQLGEDEQGAVDLVLPLASLQASVLSEAGNGFIEAVVVPNLAISVTGMTIIITL